MIIYLSKKSHSSALYLNELTQLVHSDCHRNFSDKKRPKLKSSVAVHEIPSANYKGLRFSTALFNWKDDCLLCAKPAIMDTRHPQRECACAQDIYHFNALQSSRVL